jgi:hypothetical protein
MHKKITKPRRKPFLEMLYFEAYLGITELQNIIKCAKYFRDVCDYCYDERREMSTRYYLM